MAESIRKLRAVVLSVTSLCLTLFSGCGDELPDSLGPAQHILVLADSSDWVELEETVRDVFEKVLYTPQEELVFSVEHGLVQDFERYKYHRRKNILILSPVDAVHPAGEFLRRVLSPDVQDAIRGDQAAASWKENIWAKDQVLLTVSGHDIDGVRDNLRLEADRLLRAVEKNRDRQIAELIYKYGERSDLTKELAKRFGWSVRVSFGYNMLDTHSDSGFVILTKNDPTRWLFVYWEDGIPPDRLTQDWCIQKRDEVTRRFFEGDRIVQPELAVAETEFSGKLAVGLQGVWENPDKWAGGPFRSYAFVDVDRDRFYLIDVGVYAPNKKKEPYLRQVDLMARTFSFAEPEQIR